MVLVGRLEVEGQVRQVGVGLQQVIVQQPWYTPGGAHRLVELLIGVDLEHGSACQHGLAEALAPSA